MRERLEEGRKPWNFGRKVFNWKPELHPRDRKGRFINVFKKILNLEVGQHYDLNKVVKDAPNIQQGTVWRNRQGWEVRTQTRQGIWGTQINNRDLLNNEDIFDDFLMVVNEGEHFPDAPLCPCGCGNKSASGGLLPGHDARARGRLQAKALKGDQQALKAALAIPEPASLKPDRAPGLMTPDADEPVSPNAPDPDADLPGAERFDSLSANKLIKDRWFTAYMHQELYDYADADGNIPDWEEVVGGHVEDWEVGENFYDAAQDAYRDAERIWETINLGGMPETNLRDLGFNIRKMAWMVEELWDDGKFMDEDQEQAMLADLHNIEKAATERVQRMRQAQEILGIDKYDHPLERMDTFEFQMFVARMMQLTEKDFIDHREGKIRDREQLKKDIDQRSAEEMARREREPDSREPDPNQDVKAAAQRVKDEMRDENGQLPPPSLFEVRGDDEEQYIRWLQNLISEAAEEGVESDADIEAVHIAYQLKTAYRAPIRKPGEPPEPEFMKQSRRAKRQLLDEWVAKYGIEANMTKYEVHDRIVSALEDGDYPPGISPALRRLEEFAAKRRKEAELKQDLETPRLPPEPTDSVDVSDVNMTPENAEKSAIAGIITGETAGRIAAKEIDAQRRQEILDKWDRLFSLDPNDPLPDSGETDRAAQNFDESLNNALDIIETSPPHDSFILELAVKHLKNALEAWPDIKDRDTREDATRRYRTAKKLLDDLKKPPPELPTEWQRISERGDDRLYGFSYRDKLFNDELKASVDERNKEKLDVGRALGFDMETATDEEILEGVTEFLARHWEEKFESMDYFDQISFVNYLKGLNLVDPEPDEDPLEVWKKAGKIDAKKIARTIQVKDPKGYGFWSWMIMIPPKDHLYEEIAQSGRRKEILDKWDKLWSLDPGVVDGRQFKNLSLQDRTQFLDDLRYMTLDDLPRRLAMPYAYNYDPIMGRKKAKPPKITPDVPDKPVSDMTLDEIKEVTERIYEQVEMGNRRSAGTELMKDIPVEDAAEARRKADAVRASNSGFGPSRTGGEAEIRPEDHEMYEVAAYFQQGDHILEYFERKGEPIGGLEFIDDRHIAEYHSQYILGQWMLLFKNVDKYPGGHFNKDNKDYKFKMGILKERGLAPDDLFDPDELKDADLKSNEFWDDWLKRATDKLTGQMLEGDVLDPDDYPELEHTGWPYTGVFDRHMNLRGRSTWWANFKEWSKYDPETAEKLKKDRTRYLFEVRRQIMEETYLGLWSDKIAAIKSGEEKGVPAAHEHLAHKWFTDKLNRAEIDKEIAEAFEGFLYDLALLEGVNAPGNQKVSTLDVKDMKFLIDKIKKAIDDGEDERIIDGYEGQLKDLLRRLSQPHRERSRDYPFLDSGFDPYVRSDRTLYSPAFEDDLSAPRANRGRNLLSPEGYAAVGPSMNGPRHELVQGPRNEFGDPVKAPDGVYVPNIVMTGDLMTNVNYGRQPFSPRTYGRKRRKSSVVSRMVEDARRYGEKVNLRKVLSEVVPFVNDRKCSCGCGGTVPFQRGRSQRTGVVQSGSQFDFLPGHKERADIGMFEAAARGDFKAISDIRSDPTRARQFNIWASRKYAGSPDPSVPDIDKDYTPEELAFSPERIPEGIPVDSEYALLLDPGPGEKHIQVQRLTVRRDRATGSTERGLLNETLRRLRWGVGRRDDETVSEYERRMNDIDRDTPDLYGNDDGPIRVIDYPSAEQQEQELRENLDLTPQHVPMRGTALEGGGYRVVNVIKDPHYQREEGDGIVGEARLMDDPAEAERIEEILRDMGAFVGPSSYTHTGHESDPKMRSENQDVTDVGRATTLSVWIPIGDGKYVEYFPEVTDHSRQRGPDRYNAQEEHENAQWWGSIDRAPEFDSPDGLTPDMQAEGFHANPYSLRNSFLFEGMSPREIDDFIGKLFPNSKRERQAAPRLSHHGETMSGRPFVYREEVADGSVIPNFAHNVGIIHKVGKGSDEVLMRSSGLKPQSMRRIENRETRKGRATRGGALTPKRHSTETGVEHRVDAGLSPGGDFASGIDGLVFTNIGVGIEYLADPSMDIWIHPKYAYAADVTMVDFDQMDDDRYNHYANFMQKIGSAFGKGVPADFMSKVVGDYPDVDPAERFGEESRGGYFGYPAGIPDLPSGHPIGQVSTHNELNIPDGVPWRDIPAINFRDPKMVYFATRAIREGRGNGVFMVHRDLDLDAPAPQKMRKLTDNEVRKYIVSKRPLPDDGMVPDDAPDEALEAEYQDFLKFLDRVHRENPAMQIHIDVKDPDVPRISEMVNRPTGFGGKKKPSARTDAPKRPLGRGASNAASVYGNLGLDDDTSLGSDGLDVQGKIEGDMPEATIKHARAWQKGLDKFMEENFPTVPRALGEAPAKKFQSDMSIEEKLKALVVGSSDVHGNEILGAEERIEMSMAIKPLRALSREQYTDWKDEFPPWWYRVDFNFDDAVIWTEGDHEEIAQIMGRLGRYIDMDELPDEFKSLTPEMQLKWLFTLPILGPDSLYGPGTLKAERVFT